LFGGVRFYERREVKDILAYLKAIHNPADDLACARIINVPRRGIGDTTMARIMNHAAERGISLTAAIAQDIPGVNKKNQERLTEFSALLTEWTRLDIPPSALLRQILADTEYLESLNDSTPEAINRIENVNELLAKAQEFESVAKDATLGSFLNEVGLVADIDNYQENADAVALMTLHSAKGLEFNRVFIVGLEEFTFPSARSVLSESASEIEEERRLCYVGFTRARQYLYLSHAASRMRNGQRLPCATSRFLKELPPSHLESVNAYGKPRGYKPSQARPASGGPASFIADMHVPIPTFQSTTDSPFAVGDKVRDPRYGAGVVIAISPAGADHELTIDFPNLGHKKRMAKLFKITKA
jgi:DNA helicase-2/ATP-dependent DNA helicase PcrA